MDLKPKQKAFADFYMQFGNATAAAIKAGYSEKYAGQNADKLLKNTNIQEYIKERSKLIDDERIADMVEVKQFWTDIMRDAQYEPKDRLKASEYIAKTNGAFLDKIEHSGELDAEVTITIGGKAYGEED